MPVKQIACEASGKGRSPALEGPMPQARARYFAPLTLLTGLLLAGSFTALAGGGGPPVATTPPASSTNTLTVRTTLATLANKTLPLRFSWVATPSLETYDLRTVQFYIDDKLVSTPQNAPYTFNGPGNFLVTTWLAPGRHTFTTKVTALDGRTATETITATVAAAPQPPAEIAGAWERVITAEQFEAAGLDTGNDPVLSSLLGKPWRIIIDPAGLWIIDPEPGGSLSHINLQGNTLTMLGPVRTGPNGSVRAYGAPLYGDNMCGPVNRDPGTYTWAATGTELTVTAVKPACASEQVILSGIWTRVTPTPKR
ncbi:hypothetical protein [Deinococcus hohokamensis]|uniref:PKD domain-containing protein n=1 Tax=Deinococcus hohokamensis TaxID=309883 RepID=A0ABV9I674_9DEIO